MHVCTKKWQTSAVTAPRWRACGCSLQWPFRFSACLDICMIESWGGKGEKTLLFHSRLGVIPSGMGISCLPVIDPSDSQPPVTPTQVVERPGE